MDESTHRQSLPVYFTLLPFPVLEYTVRGFLHVLDDIIAIRDHFIHTRPNPVCQRKHIAGFIQAVVHVLVNLIHILLDVILSQHVHQPPRQLLPVQALAGQTFINTVHLHPVPVPGRIQIITADLSFRAYLEPIVTAGHRESHQQTHDISYCLHIFNFIAF